MDKPHIRWSRYWTAWECKFNGLARIGETPRRAFDAWRTAHLSGAKR